jgi:hypothetical protein
MPMPPDECAQCGASIPRSARACPECGADERTGWRETSVYDGLDLPDAPDSEVSGPKQSHAIAWYWWVVATLLVALLGFAALRGF